MSEPGEQSKSVPENKFIFQWTDEDFERFGNAFSLKDFEIVGQKGSEGYVRVRIPVSVEPMVKGIIAAGQEVTKAFANPLTEGSREVMDSFIKGMATTDNFTEAQEIELRQMFGRLRGVTTWADMAGVKSDAAVQDLKSGMAWNNYQMLTSNFKTLLAEAVESSVDRYVGGLRGKYTVPEEMPRDVADEFFAEDEKYKQIQTLFGINPKSSQTPRFQIVDSTGREIFRSIPLD